MKYGITGDELMPIRFFRIINELFWKTALVAILFFLAFYSTGSIGGSDLLFHLKSGQYISEQGAVPTKEVFSFTMDGKGWINHEWLFQIILFFTANRFGSSGLVLFQVLIYLLIFYFFILISGKNRSNYLLIGLFLAFVTFTFRIQLRPEAISLLFFTASLFFIKGRFNFYRHIFILFIMQVLWVNIHGFFFLGPLVFAINFLSYFARKHFKLPYNWNAVSRIEAKEYRRILLIPAVMALACLFNPQGINGALYPYFVLRDLLSGSAQFFTNIEELQNPWGIDSLLSFRLLAILSLAVLFWKRRDLDLSFLLILALSFFFAGFAVRNILFFAAASVAFISVSTDLSAAKEHSLNKGEWPKLILSLFLRGSIILALCGGIFLFVQKSGGVLALTIKKGDSFDRFTSKFAPVEAIKFFKENNISGNVFNDFNSGQALIYYCFPSIKVLIDARSEVYGREFYSFYKMALKGNTGIFEVLEKEFDIGIVFLSSLFTSSPDTLSQYLLRNPKWELAYLDYDGIVFLKKGKFSYQPLIADDKKFKNMSFSYISLSRRYQKRAENFISLGLFDKAKEQLDLAKSELNDASATYKLLGRIYVTEKKYAEALPFLVKADNGLVSDAEVKYELAISLYHAGRIKEALGVLEKAVRLNPGHAKAQYFLMHLYAQEERIGEALRVMYKANRLDPSSKEDLKQFRQYLLFMSQQTLAEEVNKLITANN
ncbi:MAG: tetratricopeptide repeat protein [Candidatus Omnitrophica bacterium]|nr:tetratricopeptide repeat protein [Candidatus Omnitrophota bacterium]